MLALLGTACATVSEMIPGDGSELEQPAEDATPAPDATPIVPNTDNPVGGTILPATALPDHELARTVVQIQAIDASDGTERVVRSGSGVIVDVDQQLILTSYPLVQPHRSDGSAAYTRIVIGLARQTGEEPQPTFEAEIAMADVSTQLAVLRVVGGLDGTAISSDQFSGNAALIGEVSSASAGSTVRIFGHPSDGTRTQPVSMTNAGVTGFRAAPGVAGRTWIKTDARLPYGLAGGPVFDQMGLLLGVLVQEQYLPGGEVSHARPVDLARDLIELARTQTGLQPYRAPLLLTSHVPGSARPLPPDGIWISRPLFAMNAIETPAGRDLFEYTFSPPSGTGTLYYEFAVVGVPSGTTIEERWFLDGVQQDSLSSSYVWERGRFGFVSDRVFTPSDSGLPDGRWRLEVWVDDALRATSTVLLGVPGREPAISNIAGGSLATVQATALVGPFNGADQLLGFFDFTGFEEVSTFGWTVFHNNDRVYESPEIPWTYGDAGRTWVGFRDDGPITSGLWEIEILVDGAMAGTIAIPIP
jgi:S1-C subfamily serine protease